MSRSRNQNRGDSIAPTRKRQDKTNDVQIEIEKGKEEKKKQQISQCMVVAGHASEQGALAIQVANKTTMDPKCSTILVSF